MKRSMLVLITFIIAFTCWQREETSMAQEISSGSLTAGANIKPSSDNATWKPDNEASIKDTNGSDLLGTWSTTCIEDESRSLKAHFTFMPDRKWSYSATEYREKGCKPPNAESSVREGGSFLVGQRLKNGTVEIDISIRNSLGSIYLVYEVAGKRLQLSGKCSSDDIQDKRDAYCFRQPKPIGFTMLSRSLQLFDLSYFKE